MGRTNCSPQWIRRLRILEITVLHWLLCGRLQDESVRGQRRLNEVLRSNATRRLVRTALLFLEDTGIVIDAHGAFSDIGTCW